MFQSFDPDTEYHTKNKQRRADRAYWEEKFGVGQTYAVSPSHTSYKVTTRLKLTKQYLDCILERQEY